MQGQRQITALQNRQCRESRWIVRAPGYDDLSAFLQSLNNWLQPHLGHDVRTRLDLFFSQVCHGAQRLDPASAQLLNKQIPVDVAVDYRQLCCRLQIRKDLIYYGNGPIYVRPGTRTAGGADDQRDAPL